MPFNMPAGGAGRLARRPRGPGMSGLDLEPVRNSLRSLGDRPRSPLGQAPQPLNAAPPGPVGAPPAWAAMRQALGDRPHFGGAPGAMQAPLSPDVQAARQNFFAQRQAMLPRGQFAQAPAVMDDGLDVEPDLDIDDRGASLARLGAYPQIGEALAIERYPQIGEALSIQRPQPFAQRRRTAQRKPVAKAGSKPGRRLGQRKRAR